MHVAWRNHHTGPASRSVQGQTAMLQISTAHSHGGAAVALRRLLSKERLLGAAFEAEQEHEQLWQHCDTATAAWTIIISTNAATSAAICAAAGGPWEATGSSPIHRHRAGHSQGVEHH
mmetsp:Transcript_11195/g.33581  ORF Transcript_11195/g.33581 Transcript_11195/m.33581 type:complete len:118 (-) Transcript_11195:1190-1543(-)